MLILPLAKDMLLLVQLRHTYLLAPAPCCFLQDTSRKFLCLVSRHVNLGAFVIDTVNPLLHAAAVVPCLQDTNRNFLCGAVAPCQGL
jgi:hypothetical protein